MSAAIKPQSSVREDHEQPQSTDPTFRTLRVPALGTYWAGQGGIYAGIVRGQNGAPDYHLIVGPEHDDKITHREATDLAPTIQVDGHRDFALPNRRDGHVAQANTGELFKPMWYWLSETHASYSFYAWGQYFYYGYQYYCFKDNHFRVRFVRRSIIR